MEIFFHEVNRLMLLTQRNPCLFGSVISFGRILMGELGGLRFGTGIWFLEPEVRLQMSILAIANCPSTQRESQAALALPHIYRKNAQNDTLPSASDSDMAEANQELRGCPKFP